MVKVRTRTEQLRPGDTVTGTAASGDFEDGPRHLVAITRAPEHDGRALAWWLTWEDGGHNVLYGDTMVDVARLAAAVPA